MKAQDRDPAERMDYRRRRAEQVTRKGLPRGWKAYLWAIVIAALLLLAARALGGATPF